MSGRLARFAWLRLLVGGLCAGAGALAVLPAPNSLLWKVGLAVTEWGYWLAPLALTPLLPGWRRTWAGRLGAALGVTGAALAVSSLLRAAPTAAQVPAALDAALGTLAPPATPDAPPRPRPLVALDLLRGYAAPGVQQRSVVFATPDGQALQMDVYQGPAPAHPAPGLITIHGGSWQSG
ncbi:MAG TPA: hypothetical protein VKY74_21205, partial [Chloroflexia bacterium]|nr:hypothetical protein [Chloroflexia bacterium]